MRRQKWRRRTWSRL